MLREVLPVEGMCCQAGCHGATCGAHFAERSARQMESYLGGKTLRETDASMSPGTGAPFFAVEIAEDAAEGSTARDFSLEHLLESFRESLYRGSLLGGERNRALPGRYRLEGGIESCMPLANCAEWFHKQARPSLSGHEAHGIIWRFQPLTTRQPFEAHLIEIRISSYHNNSVSKSLGQETLRELQRNCGTGMASMYQMNCLSSPGHTE